MKATVSGTEVPGATTVPLGRLVVAENPWPAAGGADEVMVRGEALVLVTTKVWVSVTPTGMEPNERLEGDSDRATPGVTVSVADAVVTEPRALVKIASYLVPDWETMGVNV